DGLQQGAGSRGCLAGQHVAWRGCIGGAGCLTHGTKDKSEIDRYGMEAYEKKISDAVSVVTAL
ncbi:MAG: hypothetical protein RR276_05890, partial [Angelakisella sp.]